MKHKDGVTLVELMTVLVVGSIVVAVMTCQFVAAQRSLQRVNDRITALNDASVVMHAMTRTLRYAKPTTIAVTSGSTKSISATIESGHLADVTADTSFVYRWPKAGAAFTLEQVRGGVTSNIANDVTDFVPSYSSATNVITIMVTTTRNGQAASLVTRISPVASG